MRYTLLAALFCLIAACDDDAPVRPDAIVDAPPDSPAAPAIDWAIWGQPCTRGSFGMVTCVASDGMTPGLCIVMGASGTCEPQCLSQPGHATECPPDAVRTENANTSDGCWCKER